MIHLQASTRDRQAMQTREKICDAALRLIGEHGLAKLTHRAIAQSAGTSLATTTYHFATKREILSTASERFTTRNSGPFHSSARDAAPGFDASLDSRQMLVSLLEDAVSADRSSSLAWFEIMLGAAADARLRAMSRKSYARLDDFFTSVMARTSKPGSPGPATAADVAIGLLLIALALGVDAKDIGVALTDRGRIVAAMQKSDPKTGSASVRKDQGQKSAIADQAADLLLAGGPSAVTHRAVAKALGCSASVIAYHHGSITDLLEAAQLQLFADARERYLDVVRGAVLRVDNIGQLASLLAAFLVKETSQFERSAAATMRLWLEAARDPALRPVVSEMFDLQRSAWAAHLATLASLSRGVDGLIIQAQFLGRMLRILALGGELTEQMATYEHFSNSLEALILKSHIV